MAGVVACLGAAFGAARADGVRIEDTGVTGAAASACQALVADLPARVSDQKQVRASNSRIGAAWGDPAIVLRCGVGRPKDFDPLLKCQVFDGTGWFVPKAGMFDQSKDVVMTAISRKPFVEVTVPARYRPPVGAMADLAAAIRAHTTKTQYCA